MRRFSVHKLPHPHFAPERGICGCCSPKAKTHRPKSSSCQYNSSSTCDCHQRSTGVVGSTEDFDCLTCGACCFQRPGTILVTSNDLVRFRRADRPDLIEQLEPGHFSHMAFKMNEQGSCVHHGSPEAPHACQIYDIRGDTCRDFERGSQQCREFRRDRGISLS